MNRTDIKELAKFHGFTERTQASGEYDLNENLYSFAGALVKQITNTGVARASEVRLTEQALGEFHPLVQQFFAASTKKERARFRTLISSFVRALHFLRTQQNLEGHLTEIRLIFDCTTGEKLYAFQFSGDSK